MIDINRIRRFYSHFQNTTFDNISFIAGDRWQRRVRGILGRDWSLADARLEAAEGQQSEFQAPQLAVAVRALRSASGRLGLRAYRDCIVHVGRDSHQHVQPAVWHFRTLVHKSKAVDLLQAALLHQVFELGSGDLG